MDIKDIKAEDLIGIDDRLIDCLSALDCHNTKHRQIAIDAMEIYVRRYISPAMYLPDTTINGVIGRSVEGLALGVMFDQHIESLERPDEEMIKFVFKDCLKHEGTQQQRDDFWAAWLLREAVGCVRSLCNFLEKPLRRHTEERIEATVLEQEIRQLQKIYKIPMTGIKSWIELLIEKEQKALAEWNK